MIKKEVNVKLVIIVLLFFILPIALLSQNKELTKSQKKEIQEKEKEEELAKIYKLIQSRMFIIEVDQIILDDGSIVNVNSTTNFFSVDSSKTNIQITYNFPIGQVSNTRGTTYYGDKNGISMEANIDKYDLKDRKPGKPVILSGSMNSFRGPATFSISVNSSSIANVTVRNQNGGQTVFQGKIYSFEDSKVFINR